MEEKNVEKKYAFTEEVIEFHGRTLHRIKAIRDFGNVKNGELGGFIEKEQNLSHKCKSWVSDNAKVYDNAVVCDNALVYDNAWVSDNANISDNANVCGNAKVYDDANVYGNTRVCDNVLVYGRASVCGDAWVYDNAKVYGNARVSNNARVYDNAKVYGNVLVYGRASVCGDAEVSKFEDYIVFKNWWSSGRYFTWTRSNDMWRVGCFYGTGDELIKKAYEDDEEKGKHYEEIVKYVEKCVLNKK